MSVIKPNHHPNRESWLNGVAGRLRPAFAQLGAPLPDRLRIAIGFPSGGQRAKATGECWDSTASADGTFEILIRPDLAEADGVLALSVAAALAHELVHAAVGIQAGKGPAFRRVALGIGLTGPMRATAPGPAFLALISPILDAVGPLPHAASKPIGNPLRLIRRAKAPRLRRRPASSPTGTSNAPAPPAVTSPAPRANGWIRSDRPTALGTGKWRWKRLRSPLPHRTTTRPVNDPLRPASGDRADQAGPSLHWQ